LLDIFFEREGRKKRKKMLDMTQKKKPKMLGNGRIG